MKMQILGTVRNGLVLGCAVLGCTVMASEVVEVKLPKYSYESMSMGQLTAYYHRKSNPDGVCIEQGFSGGAMRDSIQISDFKASNVVQVDFKGDHVSHWYGVKKRIITSIQCIRP
jgi:hypothetical protein